MFRLLKKLAIGMVLVLAFMGVSASQAQTIQATTLSLISPSTCPPNGCAAGQTVDLRVNYDLAAFDPAASPNVQVCIYTPTVWAAESFRIETIGAVSGAGYTASTSACLAGPDGFTTIGGAQAQVPTGSFGDILNLGFRINRAAATGGSVLARIYQQTAGSGWVQSDQSFTAIPVMATAASVYVANDAGACGGFSPCYVNSGGDLPGGLGTGLKDAIDALPAKITVLGAYSVKSNAVLVDQTVTLQGVNDSRITYQGSTCNEAMLRWTGGGALRLLTINDGSCSTPNRDLLILENTQDVLVEYVDLVSGQDALKIGAFPGTVVLRFSQALNNSGYAVFRVPGAGGTLQIFGNNLYNNRPGVQVDCGLAGNADHNYWGAGISSSSAAAQCTVSDTMRLGAAALPHSGEPGVQGERVTVTTAKQSSFNGLISYQRSADGADYGLNLINHGAGAPENVPFTGGAPGSLVACSNYYDVFLENGAVPSAQLNLALRYDRTSGCTTSVESAAYCAAADPALYPLWWYSPALTAPAGWNTTGATGQVTSCDTAAKEISVQIDASDRPDFLNDLNYTPFVVGLLPQQSSVVITRFEAIPGLLQAAVQWITASEVNTSGFYVLRSLAAAGPFDRVSNFVPHTGTSSSGSNYEYMDTGLTNNATYYYRLEIISSSLGSTFSNVISATIGQPTSTVTQTLTPTRTVTATSTITPTGATTTATSTITSTSATPTATGTMTATGSPTATRTRTITLTRLPTRTRTPIRYATFYQFRSPTPRPTRTLFPTRTITPTWTLFPGARTSTAEVNGTLLPPQSPTVFSTATLQIIGLPSQTATLEKLPTDGTAIANLITVEPPGQGTPLATIAIIDLPSGETEVSGLPTILRFGTRNWRWILGLLGLEVAILAVVVLLLRRRGLLMFPPYPQEDPDPFDDDIQI